MGRLKLHMKKIDDTTKYQITYSKRRNGLFKKIKELSILCDVDIAVVTFSRSGRLSLFPERKILLDVLKRYINLPLNQRNYSVEVPEPMFERLDHIKDHNSKIIFVNNQIKFYEKQIAISQLELQILEAELRSFDHTVSQATTLTEIHWQENFLHGLLKQLRNKKDNIFTGSNLFDSSQMAMRRNFGRSSLFNANIEDLNRGPQFRINNSQYNSVFNQNDSWLHSSRPQYGHSFHGLLNPTMGSPAADFQLQTTANLTNNNNNNSNISFASSPFWSQFCASSAQQQPLQMPPLQYQPMFQETSVNEIQAGTDATMFDPDEINWLRNIMRNHSEDQNSSNMPQPVNSPRVPAPSMYDPMFQGIGKHVDPFFRVYNSNNNNLESHSPAFQEEMPQQVGIPGFQASPVQPDPAKLHIQNLNDITYNHEEEVSINFPPVPPQSEFHELRLENKIQDVVNQPTNPENKDEEDDEEFDYKQFFADIPDNMINLDGLELP